MDACRMIIQRLRTHDNTEMKRADWLLLGETARVENEQLLTMTVRNILSSSLNEYLLILQLILILSTLHAEHSAVDDSVVRYTWIIADRVMCLSFRLCSSL